MKDKILNNTSLGVHRLRMKWRKIILLVQNGSKIIFKIPNSTNSCSHLSSSSWTSFFYTVGIEHRSFTYKVKGSTVELNCLLFLGSRKISISFCFDSKVFRKFHKSFGLPHTKKCIRTRSLLKEWKNRLDFFLDSDIRLLFYTIYIFAVMFLHVHTHVHTMTQYWT